MRAELGDRGESRNRWVLKPVGRWVLGLVLGLHRWEKRTLFIYTHRPTGFSVGAPTGSNPNPNQHPPVLTPTLTSTERLVL